MLDQENSPISWVVFWDVLVFPINWVLLPKMAVSLSVALTVFKSCCEAKMLYVALEYATHSLWSMEMFYVQTKLYWVLFQLAVNQVWAVMFAE